jgi:primosomal replication protein N
VSCNRFVICGEITALDELRYTPVGLERVELKIQHHSTQQQAGMPRQVQCEVTALALGEVARKVAGFQVGQKVKAGGFIAQRSLRSTQLVLHIENIILE